MHIDLNDQLNQHHTSEDVIEDQFDEEKKEIKGELEDTPKAAFRSVSASPKPV